MDISVTIIKKCKVIDLSMYLSKEGWWFRFDQKWLHSTSELSSEEAAVGAKNSVSARTLSTLK